MASVWGDAWGVSWGDSWGEAGAPAALAIATPATLPKARLDRAYTRVLSATGGDGAYIWTVTAGTLPVGLTLDTDGSWIGAPEETGTFVFTVNVVDEGLGDESLEVTLDVTDSPAKGLGGASGLQFQWAAEETERV